MKSCKYDWSGRCSGTREMDACPGYDKCDKYKPIEDPMYLYAVRDRNTGKLVADLVRPAHKFWQREGQTRNAIKGKEDRYKIVKFELVERN